MADDKHDSGVDLDDLVQGEDYLDAYVEGLRTPLITQTL